MILRESVGRCQFGESLINVDSAKLRSPAPRLLQMAANGSRILTEIFRKDLSISRNDISDFFLVVQAPLGWFCVFVGLKNHAQHAPKM